VSPPDAPPARRESGRTDGALAWRPDSENDSQPVNRRLLAEMTVAATAVADPQHAEDLCALVSPYEVEDEPSRLVYSAALAAIDEDPSLLRHHRGPRPSPADAAMVLATHAMLERYGITGISRVDVAFFGLPHVAAETAHAFAHAHWLADHLERHRLRNAALSALRSIDAGRRPDAIRADLRRLVNA